MHNVGGLPGVSASRLPSTYSKRGDSTFVERVSNSFTGSLLGLGLVAIGLFSITVNESFAAYVSWQLDDGLRNIVPLESSEVIFTENNNKLIHVTGKLRTTEPLVDSQFGISVRAVKLRRHVQMYQWVEHRKQLAGDDIQYTYTKEWRSELIDSETFENSARHTNKKEMSVQGTTFVAIRAYIGNFQLKEPLKEKIESFDPYIANQQPPNPSIKLHNGFYYFSLPNRPMIGDVRVTFSYAGVSGPENSIIGPPATVSIIAKQAGGILTNYVDNSGTAREMVQMGKWSAEEMLIHHLNFQTSLTWCLRIGGWLMVFLGFFFMKLIIFYVMDLVPALQKIASFGLINFNLCSSFSLALGFAALCYIMTRPFQALLMMTIALLPAIIAFLRHKKSHKESLRL
nr:transmembrane protein 43-like [Lytechinus pictus]